MKKISLSLLLGLIISIITMQVSALYEDKKEYDNLQENVLRLHILANSNTQVDQNLKLAIKDEIVKSTSNVFISGTSFSDAYNTINGLLSDIEDTAKKIINQKGFNYNVKVALEKKQFASKDYTGFTMPQGEYMALTVYIGSGQGDNWWCVLYPPMCLGATTTNIETDECFTKKQQDILKNPTKYKYKFKIFEIFDMFF